MLVNKQNSFVTSITWNACLFAGALMLLAAGSAQAATPTVFANCPQLHLVNGLAATQSRVLFTTHDQPNVFQIDPSGTVCTLFAVIPPAANPAPAIEEYIAISSGAGGFPAGWIYVTQYEKVFKVSPDGTSVSLFATIPTFTNHALIHSGITFDQSGNYGFQMIVTGQNAADGHGEIYTVNSGGTVAKFVDLTGGANTGITEAPTVTPLTFTPAPGKLLVSQEEQNLVLIVNPDRSITTLNTQQDIETVDVIPQNLCPLVGANASFFVSDWANARILKYSPADVPAAGALLTIEYPTPTASVYFENTSGGISTFDSNQTVGGGLPIVHEGSAFVTCNAGTVCPLSPGYWKNHAFPTTVTYPVIIGGIKYSQLDLQNILHSNPAGGNAVQILGFQLVAALLNIANGANVPANVANTIADAESLLNGVSLFSFIQASTPTGQLMVADANILSGFNTSCNQ